MSADLSSMGQIEVRLSRYGKLREEDRDALVRIISPDQTEPAYFEDSLLY
jgi:hypothetical protein